MKFASCPSYLGRVFRAKHSLAWVAAFAAGLLLVAGIVGWSVSAEPAPEQQRAKFQQNLKDGNFKDAFDGLRGLALNKADDPLSVGNDLTIAIECLNRLGREDEIDDFREQVIAAHAANWRLLRAAADSLLQGQHFGNMIAGKFSRGFHRQGGDYTNSIQRDQVRALQLMQQALPLVAGAGGGDGKADAADRADFYMDLAHALLANHDGGQSWRLQVLTDLGTLPDYGSGWGWGGGETRGAPVDAAGNPVFYSAPKRWKDAANDGQHGAGALAQAAETSAARTNDARMELANFLHGQFGVQTMAEYGFFGAGSDGGGDDGDDGQKAGESHKSQTGPFAVQTLADDETIARLATGIKRFKLPDEFNFIKIYQEVADDPKTGRGDQALEALAQIFENRRQYPRAAETWRRAIKEYGKGQHEYRQHRLEQIVGNWGRFEPVMSQPAGKGAVVDFTFRNGRAVSFEAHEIKIERLLENVKAYLKTQPQLLDWQKVDIGNLGYLLVEKNEQQYLGEKVAAWDLKLDPPADHFDRRIQVSTPLQKAGAYLLTAKMADGNTSRVIVWVADTAIVRKPLDGKTLYLVADAATGKPLDGINIELFGYQQRWSNNHNEIDFANFAEQTNADGQAIVDLARMPQGYQWVAIARGAGGRLAYLGFMGIWHSGVREYEAVPHETRVFAITDRPVYRPAQSVKFKFWIGTPRYDGPDTSEFANQQFTVELHNPKGEKILSKQFTADAFGGLDGQYDLPADATLGVYRLAVFQKPDRVLGGGSFRVEEYKKPEFEVSVDAPSEPVMLGDKIKATIRAKYYFGSPVVNAKVKYKILRTSYSDTWYPPRPWDWLFGPGYWWFGCDYNWYPGWNRWGWRRPLPTWWRGGSGQPEVVADVEAPIGPDGTLPVEIDTAVAKAIHPDQDHRYEITAEVVDASRRTIVGSGAVLVARKPFQVTAWLDRGYYQAGDPIEASFAARTLAGKPVAGHGHLVLYKISYDAKAKPAEKAVEEWNVDTDAEGLTHQQLKAAEPGQFRLSYKLTDTRGHTIEGGYVFAVRGEGFNNGASYRFNDLELIADRPEYAPGDKVRLMVNVNRPDSTVWLFLRPMRLAYSAPKTLRLEGKSTVVEIDVARGDMPNFFVEALTISAGRIFSETREIVVPPEKRIINVTVTPSRADYKPGQKATVGLKLTDAAGRPIVGSTVVAIYDKAVEYISGGSNVPEIRAFFWNWRRMHNPSQETNLERSSGNILRNDEIGMGNLGVFGELAAGVARMDLALSVDEKGKGVDEARLTTGRVFGGGGLGASAGKPGAANYKAMQQDKAPAAAFAAPLLSDASAATLISPSLIQPTIRSNFADTALWVAALSTNEKGEAEVALTMPENLTTWKIKTWAMGQGTKVGHGEAEVVTRKDVIIRLQAPRFFVETDEVVLSGNVHNYLKTAKQVKVVLELSGKELAPLDELARQVEVPAGGETRVDWRVRAAQEGQATVEMKALTDEESDAVKQSFPVYVHGMLKTDSFSGALRPQDASGKITLDVPAKRRPAQSLLEVRYSPTLAGAMVDALPYLADYPYGCTEQTLNRFLPTVVTQRILIRMGLDLKEIARKRTNLNAQQIGDDRQRAADWKLRDANSQTGFANPVFDNAEVARMVKAGVQRLTEMQLTDGGWGWFSGFGEHSWPHTTATVVHGLQVAKQNDVALVPGMLERGVEWLTRYQNEQVRLLQNGAIKPEPKDPYKTSADNLDALVYGVLIDAGVRNGQMLDFLYRDRNNLAVYGKALFGLALQKQPDGKEGQPEKLAMILQNIRQYVVEDNEDQTAYLKLPAGDFWWNWYGSETEANANFLKLLARTDPHGELAPRLVKYLLNNRRHGTYWDSTRDTSLAIEALAEYLRASGEEKPDLTVEVFWDGKKQKEVHVGAADLFSFDNKFVVRGDAITAGRHVLELRKQGTGPLYYNAYLTNFTLEEMIPRAGLEVKVNRKVYKLVRDDRKIDVAGSRGQAVGQRVERYKREELKNLDTLKSGDLAEVELEIDSKNDYEYLIFEDMKAAGFEPVDLQSGYGGNALGAYMELRDNRVSFFIRSLARGKHSVSYRLRAETPGRFSALPARASAMYAPELRGNSDEIKLKIED